MHRSSSPQASGSSNKPLKRGKACLTCRFLKIKCDGARPICGPCHRAPKDDPCEYADGPGRSRTKALEETVSRLEARLREYEHPNETPAVTLHNPYGQGGSDSGLQLNTSSSPTLSRDPYSAIKSPPSPFYTTSPLSAVSSPRPGHSPTSSDRTTRTPSAEYPESNSHIPSPAMRNMLDTFFAHATCFGFFLNISRFYNSALLPLPWGHHSRPCPALLSSVYLWGVHLSPQTHQTQERAFMLRALRDTATELCSPHPHRVVQTIQAEVLLGYYFFRNGNLIEAKRHASSAASLALGCGLNKIRSSNQWPSIPLTVGPSVSSTLHDSHDPVEEGERINGFWAAFTLYRNLAVAVDSTDGVCGVFDAPGIQIDTPWPLDMESYKEGILPPHGQSTMWNFLNHAQPRRSDISPNSTSTLVAKASVLLHQAAFIAGQYSSNMTARDSQSFFAAFQSLNHLIESTRGQLPSLRELDATSPTTRLILLAHSLTYASTIRLHGIFAHSDSGSRQHCVAAAVSMLHSEGLSVTEFGVVNPIMGTCWSLGCQTLIDEIIRVRSLRNVWSPQSSAGGVDEHQIPCLRRGVELLHIFSANSPFMTYQNPRCFFDGTLTPTPTPTPVDCGSSPSSLYTDHSEHGSKQLASGCTVAEYPPHLDNTLYHENHVPKFGQGLYTPQCSAAYTLTAVY